MEEPDPGTLLAEMHVNAVGIQETLAEQEEHGGPREAVEAEANAGVTGKSWTTPYARGAPLYPNCARRRSSRFLTSATCGCSDASAFSHSSTNLR